MLTETLLLLDDAVPVLVASVDIDSLLRSVLRVVTLDDIEGILVSLGNWNDSVTLSDKFILIPVTPNSMV